MLGACVEVETNENEKSNEGTLLLREAHVEVKKGQDVVSHGKGKVLGVVWQLQTCWQAWGT